MISVAQREKGGGGGQTHITHRHAVQTQICRRHYPLRSVEEEGAPSSQEMFTRNLGPRIPPHSLSFYVLFLFRVYVSACMHILHHECALEARRDSRSPGTGPPGSCEPLNVDGGNPGLLQEQLVLLTLQLQSPPLNHTIVIFRYEV